MPSNEIDYKTSDADEFKECRDCGDMELVDYDGVCASCQMCRDNPDAGNPWFIQPEDTDTSGDEFGPPDPVPA